VDKQYEAMSQVVLTRGNSKINALEIREGESVYHRAPDTEEIIWERRIMSKSTNGKRLENGVWRLLINLLEPWVIILRRVV